MPIHVALNPCAAVNTTTRPSLTETLLGFSTHPLYFLLEPHHVTKNRRWSLLSKQRQFRNRSRRLRHIARVNNSHIVRTSLPCRIRHSTASDRRPVSPITSEIEPRGMTLSEWISTTTWSVPWNVQFNTNSNPDTICTTKQPTRSKFSSIIYVKAN